MTMRLAYLIVQVDEHTNPDRVTDFQGQLWMPDDVTHAQIGDAYTAAAAELDRLRREHPGMALQLLSVQRLG